MNVEIRLRLVAITVCATISRTRGHCACFCRSAQLLSRSLAYPQVEAEEAARRQSEETQRQLGLRSADDAAVIAAALRVQLRQSGTFDEVGYRTLNEEETCRGVCLA